MRLNNLVWGVLVLSSGVIVAVGGCSSRGASTERVAETEQALSGSGGAGGTGGATTAGTGGSSTTTATGGSGGASCTCYNGIDSDGADVDPASTSCGFQACGMDYEVYSCEASGWTDTGTSCQPVEPLCTCYGGIDSAGNVVDPADTFCGYEACGQDGAAWECTTTGWLSHGTPSCSNGVDIDGNAVDPASTYCGYAACGTDDKVYVCDGHGWDYSATACADWTGPLSSGSSSSSGSSTCTCYNGGDNNYNPVDPASTFCGFQACGEDLQFWTCQSSGWVATGVSCP